MRVANSWLILNEGGGPTDDKPDVILETPPDPNRTSAFLNIRVADIAAVYDEWRRKGVEFLTEPKDHGARESARTCATPTGISSRSVSPPASSTGREHVALGAGAEPGLVGVERPVGTAHVGVVVREDPLRALPRRARPRRAPCSP